MASMSSSSALSSVFTNNKLILPCQPFVPALFLTSKRHRSRSLSATTSALSTATSSAPRRNGFYKVGDFMTRKEDLHVVRPTTTVDEAWETLVEKKVTGCPVVDDDWNLVGVISDYDLLVLDSISGCSQCDTSLFPDVDISWRAFNELQKLLIKTNGKVVGDLMTPNPLVVHETTNLEAAARMLLQTKYHRLPVVNRSGKLVGIVTRGDVVKAALQIKQANRR